MRKFLSAVHNHGRQDTIASRAPSFSVIQHQDLHGEDHAIPVVNTAVDLATLLVTTAVLLLSLLSFSCIFHLRLRARTTATRHLHNFNTLWTVRLLLVLFISYWALNEILRIPFFKRRYISPIIPAFTPAKQAQLCNAHLVFSLGFLEPGFLITLLFLIKESVKPRNRSEPRSLLWVFFMSLPTLILQTLFVSFTPFQDRLPPFMTRTSLPSVDDFGNQTTICTYPLLSSVIFGAFAFVYSIGLLFSCWRVVILVINRAIRVRIKVLGSTVIISLLVQTLFLGGASFWTPQNLAYGVVLFGMCVSVAVCAAAAEVVLVIKPIVEALTAAGESLDWNPVLRFLPVAGECRVSHNGRG